MNPSPTARHITGENKKRFVDLEHGVDLVISGHYHSYQRGSLDGVAYTIIGGGGSNLPGFPPSIPPF